MLRRTAVVLLVLLLTAAAGLFAADRMGVNLPWSVASMNPGGPAEREAAEKAAEDLEQAAEEAEEAIAAEPETAIEETVAALTPESDTPASGSVALDISRVSPNGPSVFAGRTDPDAYVTVFEDGKPAGTVQADASGSWSLSTEHKFASVDPNITFKSTTAPPPQAEPEAPSETAAATDSETPAPAEPAEDTSAPAVAGDVMRKFEKLVSEAREDAAREKAAQEETAKDDAKGEEDRQPERAAPDVAERESEPEPNQMADRETTVAAANDNEPAKPAPSASSQPQREEAKAQDNEADEPASDAKASGEADTTPSSKTTVSGETAEKSGETDTAMMAAPGKSAKPEAQAPIPVPIMFVYNEPTLTSEGERAADLLLEYLLLKRLDSVELTGHADERGTLAYNFDLSRERLETVAEILKEGGYKGDLKLTPKGKTEPFTGIDRSNFSGEALYQFDRRVELRITR